MASRQAAITSWTRTVPAVGIEPTPSRFQRDAPPVSHTGIDRASGGTRTHLGRITGAVLGPSSDAGAIKPPLCKGGATFLSPLKSRIKVAASILVRNRTPSATFEASHASGTPRGFFAPTNPVEFQGLESNQHQRVQGPPSYRLDDPGSDRATSSPCGFRSHLAGLKDRRHHQTPNGPSSSGARKRYALRAPPTISAASSKGGN